MQIILFLQVRLIVFADRVIDERDGPDEGKGFRTPLQFFVPYLLEHLLSEGVFRPPGVLEIAFPLPHVVVEGDFQGVKTFPFVHDESLS